MVTLSSRIVAPQNYVFAAGWHAVDGRQAAAAGGGCLTAAAALPVKHIGINNLSICAYITRATYMWINSIGETADLFFSPCHIRVGWWLLVT
jgi:hypothetical protein